MATVMIQPALISLAEANRKVFGFARTSPYRMIREGQFPIPVVYVGRRIFVRRDDLDRFLNGEPPRVAGPERG